MKKRNITLIIIGILMMIVPFFINVYNFLRFASILLGIVLISLGFIIEMNHKIIRILIVPLCLIALFYFSDYFITYFFKTIPIISYRVISSDKVETYNSLLYRIYKCDNEFFFDHNYESKYICDKDYLSKIPVNKFLENPKENYQSYQNKFVRIEGKITTIEGKKSISLNAYNNEQSLNGFVEFSDNKKVSIINLTFDPNNYKVYDVIEVIGRVAKIIEKNDTYEIILDDAIMLDSNIYNDYSLIVNKSKTLEKVKMDEKLYYYGIESIYYKYDDNNIYDLMYLLPLKKESIDNLIKDKEEIKEEESDYSIYDLDEYKIIKCDNEDIIFSISDNVKNICTSEEN